MQIRCKWFSANADVFLPKRQHICTWRLPLFWSGPGLRLADSRFGCITALAKWWQKVLRKGLFFYIFKSLLFAAWPRAWKSNPFDWWIRTSGPQHNDLIWFNMPCFAWMSGKLSIIFPPRRFDSLAFSSFLLLWNGCCEVCMPQFSCWSWRVARGRFVSRCVIYRKPRVFATNSGDHSETRHPLEHSWNVMETLSRHLPWTLSPRTGTCTVATGGDIKVLGKSVCKSKASYLAGAWTSH